MALGAPLRRAVECDEGQQEAENRSSEASSKREARRKRAVPLLQRHDIITQKVNTHSRKQVQSWRGIACWREEGADA